MFRVGHLRWFGFFFLVFAQACATSKRSREDHSKRVVAVNLDISLLNLIPSDYEVFYIYPSWRDYIFENHLAKRQSLADRGKYICYLSTLLKQEIVYRESVECIKKFEAEAGKIDYLINNGNEPSVQLGGKLRGIFNIQTGLSEELSNIMSDKIQMKNRLTKNDPSIPTAKYIELSAKDVKGEFVSSIKPTLANTFGKDWKKLVFKPVSADSSIGVNIFDNDESLDQKLASAYHLEYEGLLKTSSLIIEEFVEGTILRADGYVLNGELIINFTSEYTITPKRFYHTGDPQLTLMKWKDSDKQKYDAFAQKVVKALDYKRGVMHLEFIEKPDGSIYFLEIAARTGGTLFPILKDLGFDSLLAYVLASLSQDYHSTVQKNKVFAATSLFVPKDIPSDTSKIWFSSFEHKDLTKFTSFRADLSEKSPPHASYLFTGSNIQIAAFVGESPEIVFKDAKEYYQSLTSKVKLKGGMKDNQWYKLVDQKWKEIQGQWGE